MDATLPDERARGAHTDEAMATIEASASWAPQRRGGGPFQLPRPRRSGADIGACRAGGRRALEGPCEKRAEPTQRNMGTRREYGKASKRSTAVGGGQRPLIRAPGPDGGGAAAFAMQPNLLLPLRGGPVCRYQGAAPSRTV